MVENIIIKQIEENKKLKSTNNKELDDLIKKMLKELKI